MVERYLSIAGKPGLFRLVNQGKNMLIVENLQNGKRTPAYARDKVISLADISIYTTGDDMPLYDVFETINTMNENKPVDVKAFKTDEELREYFAEVLPEFDRDRVYTNDIRKVFSWYNILVAHGVKTFKAQEVAEDEAAEAAQAADNANTKE